MIIIFDYICEVKKDNQQLQLLLQMNFFVVNEHAILLIFRIFDENKRIKRNAIYFCIFEEILAHNYHNNKYKSFDLTYGAF